MKLPNIINHIRFAGTSKVLIASAFVLTLAAAVGFSTLAQPNSAVAADFSANAIMKGGTQGNAGYFVSQLKKNAPGDYNVIYPKWGLDTSEYDRFAQTAVKGVAHKDGRITVGNQTIATEAYSLGRQAINGNKYPVTYSNGKTYHWGYSKDVFGSSSLPVLVMFNDNGEMDSAVIDDCGNPITGKKVTHSYSCKALNMNKDASKKNTYTFTTNAVTSSNVSVAKVVYDFGDGTTETKTKVSDVATHTYSKPGNYTAKVSVHINLPGGKTKVVTPAGDCIKKITIQEEPKPIFACEALTPRLVKGNNEYTFTAKASTANGATLTSADFNFGDGTTANGVKPTATNTVAVPHTFAKAGNYTVTASLTFNVGKDASNPKCKTTVKITEKTCKDTPTAPECQPPKTCADTPNAPECQPPKTTCADTPTAPECVTPPKELPKTGPVEFIGSAIGLSSVAGAGYYYLGSRRNLVSTILKR